MRPFVIAAKMAGLSPRPKKRKAPARPRVPLPRQTGGAHEDKTKRPWRRRKHKGKAED
jgi:hypothetical protein